jgi:hypothetical protein
VAFDVHLATIDRKPGDLATVVLAVEPCSDVAVLGSPDGQESPDLWEAYDGFVHGVKPLRIAKRQPKPGMPFSVWIWTHQGVWIDGKATWFGHNRFGYTTRSEVKGGTSGGPIVNRKGELVGVVSHGTKTKVRADEYASGAPLLSLALPVWIIR